MEISPEEHAGHGGDDILLRLIEVFADPSRMDMVAAIAKRFAALDIRKQARLRLFAALYRILARPEKQQELIDRLHGALGKENPWRITIMPIEAAIPDLEQSAQEPRSPEQAIREELYADVDREARIDSNFLLLVLLSTIVATVGLLESSVAIIIAAMLIAPLLGPNVAMALGSTLGARELVARATPTNAAGIALNVACAAAAGLVLPFDATSVERMARTRLGYDNIVVALAAGALSLTTRLPSILVGVMVAVALLPPSVTLGYMLGAGQLRLAGGAAALLTVNVVCVNLSAQLVFVSKGIKPRTWIERRAAQESIKIGLAVAGLLGKIS